MLIIHYHYQRKFPLCILTYSTDVISLPLAVQTVRADGKQKSFHRLCCVASLLEEWYFQQKLVVLKLDYPNKKKCK